MKLIKYLCIILIPLLLVGCWDQVELNERDYVVSIGIDYIDEAVHFTYNLPNLPVVTGQGDGDEKSFIKVIEANTLYESNKIFGSRSKRKLNFDHAKVVIFGEGVLNNKTVFTKILDEFERNPHFARTVMVLAVEEEAEEMIELEIEGSNDMGMHLMGLYENNQYDVLKAAELTLGDLINSINERDGTVLIPRVKLEEDEPMIEGLGLVINYEFRDWLSREDVEKMSWVTGKGKGTSVVTSFEEGNEEEEVTIEITKMETSLKFDEKEGEFRISVDIITEADVKAYTLNPQYSLFEEENIRKLEDKTKNILEEETKDFITMIQDEYGIDLFNMLDQMAIKNRKLWIKHNENWDDVFAKANIEVEAKVDIRRIGVAK
ncbi:Ger(x)C family germination protein [Natranaerovirga pectinivora]|uniref:Ger(X)C family germination protein n=1 Tax=Natranaerovirga pectinivora TaxID=682400 RepID=A0A4R3MLZ9_9FIRM|nr:Ger(x)C family spore germination protein [Natranaerovirga pectinivora]TCT13960.1 Ger(x)C family germination protein [Natranaerovirga pectinivora]